MVSFLKRINDNSAIIVKFIRGDLIMQLKNNLDELILRINDLRNLMISAGITNGLNSNETLKYSEELDKLIIQVQLQN